MYLELQGQNAKGISLTDGVVGGDGSEYSYGESTDKEWSGLGTGISKEEYNEYSAKLESDDYELIPFYEIDK